MFCPQCGEKTEEGQKFCGSCGHPIDEAVPTSENVEETQTKGSANVANPTTTPSSKEENASGSASSGSAKDAKNNIAQIANKAQGTVKSWSKRKKATAAAIAAGVLVLVIVIFAIASCALDTVSDETVKNSVWEKVSGGLIKSEYVNDSEYSFDEFKITSRENASAQDVKSLSSLSTAFGGSSVEKSITVNFSGTIRNESFESSFTGHISYYKSGNKWDEVASATIDSGTTTKPLKGVDTMEKASSNSSYSTSSSSAETKTENFTSELEGSDGSYSCTARQDVATEYWFATEKATVSQKFKFDNSSGWQKNGDASAENMQTSYKLAGKTFKYSNNSNYAGNEESSFTFQASDDPNNVSASYKIERSPRANTAQQSVSLEGTATGKITHTFGKNSFGIELNDQGQGVTISADSSNSVTVAGTGTTNALSTKISTNATGSSDLGLVVKYNVSGTFTETK